MATSTMSADMGKLGITALAPGLWRVAMPFPTPLRYSFSYLIRLDDGFVAIDLGWNCDEGWLLFQQAIERAGGTLADLRGVVVTHAHPDHYGLAPRVHAETTAWIALHPGEGPQISASAADAHRRIDDIVAWLRTCGVPASALDNVLADRGELARDFSTESPDIDLHDGEAIADTDGQLVAIHTPGHTPGHTVFYDRGRKVLFTGDHLLPRVSVNISRRPTSDPDPLGDYLVSLERIGPYDGALAAPGHEWSFDRMGQRRGSIVEHHATRLQEIDHAVRAGCTTVWEVANYVSWSRPFGGLNARGQRSALGETYAHLVRLTREGRAEELSGVPRRWRAVTGTTRRDETPR